MPDPETHRSLGSYAVARRWRAAQASADTLHRFGMNMSSDGSLHPVTVAQTLDLPMTPKKGCERFGHWVATYGAEDPRLFWTVSEVF